MRAPLRRALAWVGSGLILLTSCSTDEPSSPAVESNAGPVAAASMKGASNQALEKLGAGLAASLRDPAVRRWIRQEIDASPFVEWRVALRDVLKSRKNAQPVSAILSRSAGAGFRSEELSLLPSLELYLPIPGHRAAWTGGSNIQLAVRRDWKSDFVIYGLNGERRIVGESYRPAIPTLVLGRSEIEYADRASSVRGGARSGSIVTPMQECLECTPPPPPPPPPPSTYADPTRHTRVYRFLLLEDQEGPLMGVNEIEFFGSVAGAYKECARYNGIQAGFGYIVADLSDFNNTIATAIPKVGYTNFHVDAFEDDDDACYRRSGDDPLGGKTFGLPGYGGFQTTDSPALLRFWVVSVLP